MEIHAKFLLSVPGFSHDFIIYTLYLTHTAA